MATLPLRDVGLSSAIKHPKMEVFMGNTKISKKVTVRLSDVTAYRLETSYHRDGSRSKNEFIERAIVRSLDRLEWEQNETLPTAIQSAIDGRLGMFEDRLAKLLYKLAVETDMGLSALLNYLDVDADYLLKLRAESVKKVRATNGRLTFEQKVKEQEDQELTEDGEDDPWQD